MVAANELYSTRPPTVDYTEIYDLSPQDRSSTCSLVTTVFTTFFSTLFKPITSSMKHLKERGVKALVQEQITKATDSIRENPAEAVRNLGRSFIQIKMPLSYTSLSLMKGAYRVPNKLWRMVFLTTIIGLCTLEVVAVAQPMFTDGVHIKGTTKHIPHEFTGELGLQIAKLGKCLLNDKKGMLQCSKESPLGLFSSHKSFDGVIIGLPFVPEKQVCYLVANSFDTPYHYELCVGDGTRNLGVYPTPIPTHFNHTGTLNPRFGLLFQIDGQMNSGEFPIEEFSFPSDPSKVSCVLIEDFVHNSERNICFLEERPEIVMLGPSPKGASQEQASIFSKNHIRRTVIAE